MGSPGIQVRLRPDAVELGKTLAALREALSRSPLPQSYGSPAMPTADLKELVQRLEATLHVIQRSDLRRLLTAEVRGLDDRVSGLRLGETLNRLREALLRNMLEHLGEDGARALVSLLEDPALDFLTLLRSQDNENAHSDVIRWLLDPREAPTVAPALLHALVSTLPESQRWTDRIDVAIRAEHLSVRREVLVSKETADPTAADRIDVVVSGPDFSLAIENKTWSQEHDDQTTTYWHWLQRLPTGFLRGGVFLTPDGVTASCREFRPLSYVQLLGMLVQASRQRTLQPAERAVLAGYAKGLANGVLGRQIRTLRGR
jgi:hypothetical protein